MTNLACICVHHPPHIVTNNFMSALLIYFNKYYLYILIVCINNNIGDYVIEFDSFLKYCLNTVGYRYQKI